jgi:hypothetical protein
MAAMNTSRTDCRQGPSPALGPAPTGESASTVDTLLCALRAHQLLTLVEEVCTRRGVTPEQVCGRIRSQNVCRARQEAWWRIRHHPDREYSLHEIANLFGRNHSTIKHGIDSYQRRCDGAFGGTHFQVLELPPRAARPLRTREQSELNDPATVRSLPKGVATQRGGQPVWPSLAVALAPTHHGRDANEER